MHSFPRSQHDASEVNPKSNVSCNGCWVLHCICTFNLSKEATRKADSSIRIYNSSRFDLLPKTNKRNGDCRCQVFHAISGDKIKADSTGLGNWETLNETGDSASQAKWPLPLTSHKHICRLCYSQHQSKGPGARLLCLLHPSHSGQQARWRPRSLYTGKERLQSLRSNTGRMPGINCW